MYVSLHIDPDNEIGVTVSDGSNVTHLSDLTTDYVSVAALIPEATVRTAVAIEAAGTLAYRYNRGFIGITKLAAVASAEGFRIDTI